MVLNFFDSIFVITAQQIPINRAMTNHSRIDVAEKMCRIQWSVIV